VISLPLNIQYISVGMASDAYEERPLLDAQSYVELRELKVI